MVDRKPCWQLDYLEKPTPCFINAGATVCDTAGCTVDDEIEKSHVPVTRPYIKRLCDTHCRLSCASEDNIEFLQRVSQRGYPILSILE